MNPSSPPWPQCQRLSCNRMDHGLSSRSINLWQNIISSFGSIGPIIEEDVMATGVTTSVFWVKDINEVQYADDGDVNFRVA